MNKQSAQEKRNMLTIVYQISNEKGKAEAIRYLQNRGTGLTKTQANTEYNDITNIFLRHDGDATKVFQEMKIDDASVDMEERNNASNRIGDHIRTLVMDIEFAKKDILEKCPDISIRHRLRDGTAYTIDIGDQLFRFQILP